MQNGGGIKGKKRNERREEKMREHRESERDGGKAKGLRELGSHPLSGHLCCKNTAHTGTFVRLSVYSQFYIHTLSFSLPHLAVR